MKRGGIYSELIEGPGCVDLTGSGQPIDRSQFDSTDYR